MKRLSVGLVAAGLATLGCASQHYPSDPFRGPELSAAPSPMPGGGASGVPDGPGSSYAPSPAAYPGPGLQSAAPPPAVHAPAATPSAYAPDPLMQASDPSRAVPAFEVPVPGEAAAQPPPGWRNTVAAEPAATNDQTVTPIGYEEEIPSAEPGHGPIDGQEQFRGRDSEYRWISGRLEYVAMDGKWQVRYAPYSVEDDRFGGSLLLEDDPRLTDFESGDIVYVEGELVNQPTRIVPDNAVYRIKSIRPL